MEYLAVPFDPTVSRADNAKSAAEELQSLITSHASIGWKFIGLQNHSTVVPGDAGCFGIGASPSYPKTISIAVFHN